MKTIMALMLLGMFVIVTSDNLGGGQTSTDTNTGAVSTTSDNLGGGQTTTQTN